MLYSKIVLARHEAILKRLLFFTGVVGLLRAPQGRPILKITFSNETTLFNGTTDLLHI